MAGGGVHAPGAGGGKLPALRSGGRIVSGGMKWPTAPPEAGE